MEILNNYYGWFIFIITIIFFVIYKKITKNPDAITSKFISEYKINGKINNVDNLLFNALKNSGFKNIGLDKDSKRLYAQAKFSMSSFSEFIEVYYNEQNSSIHVRFKSICALPTQIYDWGKNKRNYKKFIEELKKLQSTKVW